MISSQEISGLRTVRQITNEYPFSEGTVRWWIFNSEFNGFNSVIHRISNRILIDRNRLDEWLRSNPTMLKRPASKPKKQARTQNAQC